MCRWLLDRGVDELFDPAFGLGAFYFASKELTPRVRFLGVEKDETILAHFLDGSPDIDSGTLSLRNSDYFSVWGGTYRGIVCNPPYLRFQNFQGRSQILQELERRLGEKISGYSNAASAFLLKSLHELAPGGSLAYLMPLEFLSADYGEIVKRALLYGGRLKALLRIEPEDEVFPEVTTSVGIVLVSNDGRHEPVKFCTVQTLDQLDGGLSNLPCRTVSIDSLRPADKWLQHFEEPHVLNHTDLRPMSIYGSFSRGIATGANEFFILSKSDAEKWDLPSSTLAPCIARSSQIRKPFITDTDVDNLISQDERVLLVDLSSSSVDAVKRYIDFGERQGFDKRYLTRMRKPWFRQECRRPAPIMFGVFSRNGFKVVRNTSRAVSLTCFHCFYPNELGERFVDYLFLYFCSPVGRQIVSREVRRYGDKLDKFEPHDLNSTLVPSPQRFEKVPEDEVRRKVSSIARDGDVSCTHGMFDDLIVRRAG